MRSVPVLVPLRCVYIPIAYIDLVRSVPVLVPLRCVTETTGVNVRWVFIMKVKITDILIVGDFNFHYEDPSNVDACRFRDILSNHALCQHVSGPTHMAGHMLDLIITQSVDNIVSNTVVSDFLTDHAAIHCHLHLPKPQPLR